MRSANPFSPAFGVAPNMFFGRGRYLELAAAAMDDVHSNYRAFFIEGTRGSGKTVLLHQIADLARERKWDVYELQSTHAARVLYEALSARGSGGAVAAKVAPKVSLPGGIQISAIEAGVDAQVASGSTLLVTELLARCNSSKGKAGVLITVDEAQKLSSADAVELCSAFQAARIQGCSVMLVFAGLPKTKQQVSSFDGCTFLKRAPREVLRLLTQTETIDAFLSSFARIPEIELSQEHAFDLGHFSQGHPYLIQLIGYNLFENIDIVYGSVLNSGGTVSPGEGEMNDAKERAYWTYREDVLAPTLGGLSDAVLEYVQALIKSMDEHGIMQSGKQTALLLNKDSSTDVSAFRQRLIDLCIVEPKGYGKLRFMLPYIPRYFSDAAEADVESYDDSWNVEV